MHFGEPVSGLSSRGVVGIFMVSTIQRFQLKYKYENA